MYFKTELLLPIICLIFFIEALSVIIQVGYYKKYKKRIFLMAPIHHHFEKNGASRNKSYNKIFIITIISCLVSLLILKLDRSHMVIVYGAGISGKGALELLKEKIY